MAKSSIRTYKSIPCTLRNDEWPKLKLEIDIHPCIEKETRLCTRIALMSLCHSHKEHDERRIENKFIGHHLLVSRLPPRPHIVLLQIYIHYLNLSIYLYFAFSPLSSVRSWVYHNLQSLWNFCRPRKLNSTIPWIHVYRVRTRVCVCVCLSPFVPFLFCSNSTRTESAMTFCHFNYSI